MTYKRKKQNSHAMQQPGSKHLEYFQNVGNLLQNDPFKTCFSLLGFYNSTSITLMWLLR